MTAYLIVVIERQVVTDGKNTTAFAAKTIRSADLIESYSN